MTEGMGPSGLHALIGLVRWQSGHAAGKGPCRAWHRGVVGDIRLLLGQVPRISGYDSPRRTITPTAIEQEEEKEGQS